MSTRKGTLKLREIFRINNELETFTNNCESISGLAFGGILDYQEPLTAQIEKATKVEDSLKKKYPHKWNSEDPSFDPKRNVPARVFTGERVNQTLSKEQMNEYAVKDKKSFEDEWEKYLKKECDISYTDALLSIKEITKGSTAHGQAFISLRNALKQINENIIIIEEKK
jgi:hypothetical protein